MDQNPGEVSVVARGGEVEYVTLNDLPEPSRASSDIVDDGGDARSRLQHALLDPELPRPIKAQFEKEVDENDVNQMECTRFTAFSAQILIMTCVIMIILPATRILGIICVILVVVCLTTLRIFCCMRGRQQLRLLQIKAERWIRPSSEITIDELNVASAASTGECAICLEGLVDSESANTQSCSSDTSDPGTQRVDILRLPCGHIFHSACLSTWFDAAISCPVCRSGGVDCAPSRLRVVARADDASFQKRLAPLLGSVRSISLDESDPSEALLRGCADAVAEA